MNSAYIKLNVDFNILLLYLQLMKLWNSADGLAVCLLVKYCVSNFSHSFLVI